MKHWRRFLVVATLLLLGCAPFATPASAQVRAALVRDVDTPALSPVRANVSFSLTFINEQRLLTTVPAGKRLVIEQVSYWAFTSTGNSLVFASLRNGQFGPNALILEIRPPHSSATPSLTIQDATLPVKAYFEAGEEVWVSASKNGGTANFEIVVQGHLVTP